MLMLASFLAALVLGVAVMPGRRWLNTADRLARATRSRTNAFRVPERVRSAPAHICVQF